MISILFSRVVILTVGTLYPAYRSYKALRIKNAKEYVKWMMYWIAFALFCFTESIADIFISFWLPFYYEFKVLFVLWLLCPWTKGASILYRKWIHPSFMKHEEDIDKFLKQAKTESYKQVVTLGTRGLSSARDLIVTAALKGQAQLTEQIIQRSLSTDDVPHRIEVSKKTTVLFTQIEEEDEEDDELQNAMDSYDETIDDPDWIVERTIKQKITQIDSEEMVLIEDPNQASTSNTCRRSKRIAKKKQVMLLQSDE